MKKSTRVLRRGKCSLSTASSAVNSVLCFVVGGSVTRCCLREGKRWRVSLVSHGEGSPCTLGPRGLCSSTIMSRRCDRSACDEFGQVFLACFQGDADETRDARHNIYRYIYTQCLAKVLIPLHFFHILLCCCLMLTALN